MIPPVCKHGQSVGRSGGTRGAHTYTPNRRDRFMSTFSHHITINMVNLNAEWTFIFAIFVNEIFFTTLLSFHLPPFVRRQLAHLHACLLFYCV